MPDLPTSGIELEYSDHTVKLIPQTTAPTVGSKVGDAVTYDGAFGENTILNGFLTELSTSQSNIYTCVQKGVIKAGNVSSESGSYPLYYVGDFLQYLD